MGKKYEELQKENRELYQRIIKLEALFNQYLPDMEDYRQKRKMKLAVVKAKADLKEKETTAKMVIASTAREAAKHSQEKTSQKAKQAALDELPFLDRTTREAMNNGRYSTDYWWSNAVWEQYEITAEDFAKAVTKLLESHGYQVFNTNLIKQIGKTTRVEIMWDWGGERE